MRKVTTGLDRMVETKFALLRDKRIGVLANQAAVDSSLRHLLDLLQDAKHCTVARLFAPEHGFAGTKQDMELVEEEKHQQMSTVSLYGSSPSDLHPTLEDCSDIDVLLVDLPDIGTRYYTFAQTMAYCMKVCAEAGTKVVVLDRPNPINGLTVEGTYLDDGCHSFCGYGAIPQRHGLTLGEYARLCNEGLLVSGRSIPALNCDLEVIAIEGWNREMYFDETGLPWVLPSVNMPTLDTAIVYPGACLFEATMLSEGRGTTRPFELLGAPYIDGQRWAAEALRLYPGLRGGHLRPHRFIPKFQKLANQECGGVQIHVTNREAFSSLRWGIALLAAAHSLYPNEFAWRGEAYEFISSVPAIDLLFGSDRLRRAIEQGFDARCIEDEIKTCSAEFLELRKPFLLY